MSGQASAAAAPAVPARPPRATFAVAALLLGSFLVGADTRLLSIGLPDLRGALHLGFDDGAWLGTIATAPQILLAPATVWLVTAFGLRRTLIVPCLIYAVISIIIPFARNDEAILILHLLRGMLLGILLPATIGIVIRYLPPRLWLLGIAIYVARLPITQSGGVGLEGFYAVHLGWQWLYWQDAIIAPLMALLLWIGAPPESVNRDLVERADWGGMLLLGGGMAMIYVALDQGNRLDWLSNGLIVSMLVGGGLMLLGFLVNEALVEHPWAHASVLTRNVALGEIFILVYILTSLSSSQLISGFLTSVAGLRPEQFGGMLLLWSVVPVLVMLVVAAKLLRRIDVRLVMLIGLLAFALASWFGTRLTHEWAADNFIPMALAQAVGHAFAFLGGIAVLLANADPARAIALAAYIQVVRLGGSEMAVSQMTTWLRIREQMHSNTLGQHVTIGSAETVQALAQYAGALTAHGGPAAAAVAELAAVVQREATVLSYIDGYWVTLLAVVPGLVALALMKRTPPGPLTAPVGK
jgi:DHA2 family multidrug resistance protein